jgi:hypothetical protein
MENLKKFSDLLAKEIVQAQYLEANELSRIIEAQLSINLVPVLNDVANSLDALYNRLVDESYKLNKHSPEYFIIGRKIARIREKRKQANIAFNSAKEISKLQQLRKFVIDRYGKDVMIEFNKNFDKESLEINQ